MVQPVSTRITGLDSGQTVTATLASTDARGLHWSSSATFTADKHGAIDLGSDKPVKGEYHGTDGMGLMEALAPKDSSTPTVYAWKKHGKPQSFTLTVTSASGSPVARTTFRRSLGPHTIGSTQTADGEGFDGIYYHKVGATSGARKPAVLLFGGSEGGNRMSVLGKPLAASGVPALTIAYFGAPGLPHDLKQIPLEYFAKALRWLRKQPRVDPHRIYVLGISRGSEAAQLVAIHYPKLVRGVVLGSPTNFVHAGWTNSGARGHGLNTPAWTYHGKPVPYSNLLGVDEHGDSSIPVEKIKGTLLLACGGADEIWNSCDSSRSIVTRMKRHHSPYPHVLLTYPEAGHYVGDFYRYEPFHPLPTTGSSPTSLANQRARANLWPKLIHFLKRPAAHSRSRHRPASGLQSH